jgi:hypothetical protein
VFIPRVPTEVAAILKLPFIAAIGMGGAGVLLPPHPATRPHAIKMKLDRKAMGIKRSKYLDDSGIKTLVLMAYRKVRRSRM